MKFAFVLIALSITSAFAFAAPKESDVDHASRVALQHAATKIATSMLSVNHVVKSTDVVKLSTPVVKLGQDTEVRDGLAHVDVLSINGEPPAGGMSFDIEFGNRTAYTVKFNCLYCDE